MTGGISREDLADRLISMAPWACPGCIPTLAVELTAEAWTVAIRHSPRCTALAYWLICGTGPPPGAGEPST